MDKKEIKMIWEFRGPNALGISKHHQAHLEEYCHNNNITDFKVGLESYHNSIFIAFLSVDQSLQQTITKDLKPHFSIPIK